MTYELALERIVFYLTVCRNCLKKYDHDHEYFITVAESRIEAVADCYLWSNGLTDETNEKYIKLASMSTERFIRRFAKRH